NSTSFARWKTRDSNTIPRNALFANRSRCRPIRISSADQGNRRRFHSDCAPEDCPETPASFVPAQLFAASSVARTAKVVPASFAAISSVEVAGAASVNFLNSSIGLSDWHPELIPHAATAAITAQRTRHADPFLRARVQRRSRFEFARDMSIFIRQGS